MFGRIPRGDERLPTDAPMLQDAFPFLRDHPRLTVRAFIFLVVLVVLYRAKGLRSRICEPLGSKLEQRIFNTSRWLYVHQDGQTVNDWKYYTVETTKKANAGDDIIWKLVRWPSLRTRDSFIISGAVGMVSAVHESQSKLLARWDILHDPDSPAIGVVPALGMRSKLRRALAKLLRFIGSI
jgi:hypothetical protein